MFRGTSLFFSYDVQHWSWLPVSQPNGKQVSEPWYRKGCYDSLAAETSKRFSPVLVFVAPRKGAALAVRVGHHHVHRAGGVGWGGGGDRGAAHDGDVGGRRPTQAHRGPCGKAGAGDAHRRAPAARPRVGRDRTHRRSGASVGVAAR